MRRATVQNMKSEAKRIAPGPFKVEHLKPGDHG
jgi:hypothetical protein